MEDFFQRAVADTTLQFVVLVGTLMGFAAIVFRWLVRIWKAYRAGNLALKRSLWSIRTDSEEVRLAAVDPVMFYSDVASRLLPLFIFVIWIVIAYSVLIVADRTGQPRSLSFRDLWPSHLMSVIGLFFGIRLARLHFFLVEVWRKRRLLLQTEIERSAE